MKFETFIKEKRIEPTPTEKSVRKWANLPPANPIKKFYCVRVFCGGHCIDELEFSNAIHAQNYIQKSEQFYSYLE
jgi:hypothetical protein